MKLTFTHLGIQRTLNKHRRHQIALGRGQITMESLRHKSWYLRMKINGRERTFRLPAKDTEAIRAARDMLNGQRDKPSDFAAFLAAQQAKRSITLGQIALAWAAAAWADHNGRPRADAAARRLQHDLGTALRWWSEIPVAVANTKFEDFKTWRLAHSKSGGTRSADLENAALSSMCQWAVYARKIASNPFENRPRYHDPDDTEHCSAFAPASDEALHRVLTWFWQPSSFILHPSSFPIIAGGWLCWCALTGLRTGEPYWLARHARRTREPHRPEDEPPGAIFPMGDQTWMKVHREKRGQNPFVTLHPAALDFLAHWTTWLDTAFPSPNAATHWFPHPDNSHRALCHLRDKKGQLAPDTSRLNEALGDAVRALGLPHYTCSGFGRAYYTRVRKSQRAANAVIAEELGQTTLGKLIRTTYGRADDAFGSHRYDWLPEDENKQPLPPAWQLLTAGQTATNIITL